MTQATATVVEAFEAEFQVSGLQCFPERRWRECFLHYLFGIWGGKSNVTYRPKIAFGNGGLRLDPGAREYWVYGTTVGANPPPHLGTEIPEGHDDPPEIIVGCQQVEVEQALIRFVKNDRIQQLTITGCNGKELRFWKMSERSRLGIYLRP
ncbi:hypothetical protein EXS71_00450 [Candidatus Uhrbacteria bacterium]|nr:hypothetical protein [Candidatus Uhrbacteria bacterium]